MLRWESGGWVAEGTVHGPDVQYVVRLGPDFRTRQFLLFRDLDDPDLWLGTDGHGRWGEINGVVRDELEGCFDLAVDCTPFTFSIPIRALGLAIGAAATIAIASVDVDTLGITVSEQCYERLAARRWRVSTRARQADVGAEVGLDVELDVDEHGLVLDLPGRFRRVLT